MNQLSESSFFWQFSKLNVNLQNSKKDQKIFCLSKISASENVAINSLY